MRRDKAAYIWKMLKRDRVTLISGAVVMVFILMAVFSPLLAPHDPEDADLKKRLKPPAWMEGGDWRYPLGCDQMGRDILSRIIYGSRVSIFIGITVVMISACIGTALGLIGGYRGGWIDTILSGIVDILLAFPLLVFSIALMAATGPGIRNLILALTYKEWVPFYRLVRGEVLVAKKTEYTESARAIGADDLYIMFRHILPNVLTPVMVLATLDVANIILSEASLSFLGLGVQPPTPAWGLMINEGRAHILTAWWVSTFPGLAIVILVLALNLFGQGLREISEPKLRRR
ncbi:TPA: ABC transporter permease [Candidatus Poribacteria bacterium]|nr:ABC transporter permease [Candidatus Poribacteria bacterium]